jgi:hypothetical protein
MHNAVPNPIASYDKLPAMPIFASVGEARLHRKQRLAAAFRLFSKLGFDEMLSFRVDA